MSSRRPPKRPPESRQAIEFEVQGRMLGVGVVVGEVVQWDEGCLVVLDVTWSTTSAARGTDARDAFPDFREATAFDEEELAVVRVRTNEVLFSSAVAEFDITLAQASEMCLVSADSELGSDHVEFWVPGMSSSVMLWVELVWPAGGVDAVLYPSTRLYVL